MTGRGIQRFGLFATVILVVVLTSGWIFVRRAEAPQNATVFGESTDVPSAPSILAIAESSKELGWMTAQGHFRPIREVSGRIVTAAARHESGAVVLAVRDETQTLLYLFENGNMRFLLALRPRVTGLVFSALKHFAAFAVPEEGGTNAIYVLNTDSAQLDRVAEHARSFAWVGAPFGIAVLDALGSARLNTISSTGDVDPVTLVQERVAALGAVREKLLFLQHEETESRLFQFDLVTRTKEIVTSMPMMSEGNVVVLVSPSGSQVALLHTVSVDIIGGSSVDSVALSPTAGAWLDTTTLFIEGEQGSTSGFFRIDLDRGSPVVTALPDSFHLLQ